MIIRIKGYKSNHVLNLNKKNKFIRWLISADKDGIHLVDVRNGGEQVYISLGTFLLSLAIVIIMIIIDLAANNWVFDWTVLDALLIFFLSLRTGEFEDEKIDD